MFLLSQKINTNITTATCLHYTYSAKISHWKIRHTVNYFTRWLSYNYLNENSLLQKGDLGQMNRLFIYFLEKKYNLHIT
jgi:hypothetical protein